MRIDIHTHLSPDRIAAPVLENMTETFGYPAVGVNTVEGIKSHMRASGVDKSVVLGVVERVQHVKPANDWLISIQDDMLVPFGAIHPEMDDMPGEVRPFVDEALIRYGNGRHGQIGWSPDEVLAGLNTQGRLRRPDGAIRAG